MKIDPKKAVPFVIVAVVGIVIGLTVRADGLFNSVRTAVRNALAGDDAETKKDNEKEDNQNLHLDDEARATLGLKLNRLRPSTYRRSAVLPGMIIEKPGHSGRTVASRVNGVVQSVYCVPGQLLKAGDPLFEIRVTGDALIMAQTILLETMLQLQTTREQLELIKPAVRDGGVPKSQQIQLENEIRNLQSRENLRWQELLVRGLSDEQIRGIVKDRKLISVVTVRVPSEKELSPDDESQAPKLIQASFQADSVPANESKVEDESDEGESVEDRGGGDQERAPPTGPHYFTVESIEVHPGQSVAPGDRLAHLAWHDRLYVRGYAFERDVDAVSSLQKRQWSASIEYGARDQETQLTNYSVRFIDNHVDHETGAFHFYLELANEVMQESTDSDGRVYRSWRFKPGQRVHVSIPVEEWRDQYVLPLAAVHSTGPNAFTYRRVKRHHVDTPDGRHAHVDEFEEVPVVVVHRDTKNVVVATDGLLKAGDLVAQNRAYQLYVAIRSGSSSGQTAGDGSGHAHPHPHPHPH